MTQSGTSSPGARPRAGAGLLAVLAVVVVAVEAVAGYAAVSTFTLSTVPEDRAAAADAYPLMLGCAAVLVVVAVAYWGAAGARVPAVLLLVSAVLTALGLWTWLLTPLLLAVAIVLSFVRRR